MTPLGKILTCAVALAASTGIAIAAAVTDGPADGLKNDGELVYYEHFATTKGPGYQPDINGTAIRYDNTSSSEILVERKSTWMQMNLYWDTNCQSYAATWQQNINGISAHWGWKSYLGGIGMVSFPYDVDSVQAGKNIVFSDSVCPCNRCMHSYQDGYCKSVGYTPNDLWIYIASCDSAGVGYYASM